MRDSDSRPKPDSGGLRLHTPDVIKNLVFVHFSEEVLQGHHALQNGVNTPLVAKCCY